MKRFCLTILFFNLLLFSCKKDVENAVEIRVQNGTPLQIDKINITSADREMIFESLPAGFTTGYRNVGNINMPTPQCSIYLKDFQDPFISSDNSISQLKPGQYTCHITYLNGTATIKFTRE